MSERYSIYKITCLVNGKVYIGQTKNTAEERFKSHVANSYNNPQLFMRAIQKHGDENFKVEEIDDALSIEEAWDKERYWIDYYKSNHSKYPNIGYNMTDGGEGISENK